jgi:hypothetical protein
VSVDAGRLLQQLREAWSQAGEGDTHGHGVLRACSMTLLVLTSEDDEAQQLGATLAGLMHDHPSRTLVLRRCAGTGVAEGRAVIQCWMPFGRRQQICSEQIELRCSGDQTRAAYSAVLGLLVADLPVTMWVRDPAWLDTELIGLADKVVVDSYDFRPLPHVADLVWTRLTHTREAIARAWGSGAEEVRIRHSGVRRPLCAVYLAAWLRASLGLALRILFLPEDTGTGVVVEWGAVQQPLLPAGDEERLLHEELSLFGRDTVFEHALRAAPEFVEAA